MGTALFPRDMCRFTRVCCVGRTRHVPTREIRRSPEICDFRGLFFVLYASGDEMGVMLGISRVVLVILHHFLLVSVYSILQQLLGHPKA